MQRIGYVGTTKGGKPEGQGKYTYASGDVYEGQWKSGNKSGHGVMTYHDGSFYDGEYFLDERHGRGTYRYCNGDEYIGNWRDGRAHGAGVFRNQKYGVNYHDTWNNGRSTSTGTTLQSSYQQQKSQSVQNANKTSLRTGRALSESNSIEDTTPSPSWKSPSKSPSLVKAPPRPQTAPVARKAATKEVMRMTSLQRSQLMERVINGTLKDEDRLH